MAQAAEISVPPLVLIVDDDPVMRLLARETLEQAAFAVAEAGNGEEALALLGQCHPDLVLLDVDLPGIDGFEVCRRMRLVADSVRLPIVMVTGLDDTASISHAYELGATDFISKPINWPILGHRTRYVLRSACTMRSLQAAEVRMREALMVFEACSQGIMTTDGNGIILAINPALCEITGYSSDEAIGRKPSLFRSNRHDQPFYQALWSALRSTGRWEGEIWNRRKNGEVYPQWQSISAVRDAQGEIVEYVALCSDITQRKQQEEAIWRQANFDPLTGLANRNLLHDRLERSLSQARRKGKRLGLMFIDLDGFKWINDTLGHDVGDDLLVQVARRLQGCIREQDTAARLGGDEFTLVVQDLADVEDLLAIGDKVVNVLRKPFQLTGSTQHLSGSIGITIFPDDGDNVQALLKNADIAMYKAKEGGKNRFQFYAQHMQSDALARMQLVADLHAAISQNAFALHYQPIVDADSGELVGAEALIRWQHPERGNISPQDFIPVAEDSGLITVIGEWALRQAVQQWRRWHDQGYPPLRLAVNVSGLQFRESSLPALVAGLLAEYDVAPGCFMLEITESVLMGSDQAAEARMRDIKASGIGYALDDFGTGFSSLSYLKRFPVDVVKIDKSFVKDSPDNPNDMRLIEAIINMAHSLEMAVTAEGIETEAQLNLLRDLGCDYLQGWLIGKPVPADEFEALIRRRQLLPQVSDASLEANRLLAALRQDNLDVENWLRRLLGEHSLELATFWIQRNWSNHGLNLKQAIQAHLDWRRRLNDYVCNQDTSSLISVGDAASVSRCLLGTWIGEQDVAGDANIAYLDRVHQEFHKLAGQIVAAYNCGNRDTARRILTGFQFRSASRDVVVALISCFRDEMERMQESETCGQSCIPLSGPPWRLENH